jgi:hypothetical protein
MAFFWGGGTLEEEAAAHEEQHASQHRGWASNLCVQASERRLTLPAAAGRRRYVRLTVRVARPPPRGARLLQTLRPRCSRPAKKIKQVSTRRRMSNHARTGVHTCALGKGGLRSSSGPRARVLGSMTQRITRLKKGLHWSVASAGLPLQDLGSTGSGLAAQASGLGLCTGGQATHPPCCRRCSGLCGAGDRQTSPSTCSSTDSPDTDTLGLGPRPRSVGGLPA